MVSTPSNGGSSTGTTLFTDSDETSFTSVIPGIVARSEHIAHYFADDLEEFLRLTHVNLAEELQIPPEYSQDPRDIVAMLYDDLSHMLRDELITGIHLLLSDSKLDPNTGAYPVRYHVQYTIDASHSLAPVSSPSPTGLFGGLIAPPGDALSYRRFALLIDWNRSAQSKRHRVRRPDYNFDWIPESAKFDATTVLRYREGGLSVDGAQVRRIEKQ